MGPEPTEWWSAGALLSAELGEQYAFLATALAAWRDRFPDVDIRREVVLDDVELDTATQSARSRAVEREDGTDEDWSVWAFAVCAAPNSVFGYEVFDAESDSTTGDKAVSFECPGTKRQIGSGVSTTGAGGHAGYTSIVPDGTWLTVESTVDPTGAPDPFTVRAQTVCAFPYSKSGE